MLFLLSQRPAADEPTRDATLDRVRRIYRRAAVFDKAEKLIEKFRAKAEAVADEVEPTELRELWYYLVDTVLDRSAAPEPVPVGLPLIQLTT